MGDDRGVRPILRSKYDLSLLVRVPSRLIILSPFDSPAVNLEAMITDIGLGGHLAEREVISKISLGVGADDSHSLYLILVFDYRQIFSAELDQHVQTARDHFSIGLRCRARRIVPFVDRAK